VWGRTVVLRNLSGRGGGEKKKRRKGGGRKREKGGRRKKTMQNNNLYDTGIRGYIKLSRTMGETYRRNKCKIKSNYRSQRKGQRGWRKKAECKKGGERGR